MLPSLLTKDETVTVVVVVVVVVFVVVDDAGVVDNAVVVWVDEVEEIDVSVEAMEVDCVVIGFCVVVGDWDNPDQSYHYGVK